MAGAASVVVVEVDNSRPTERTNFQAVLVTAAAEVVEEELPEEVVEHQEEAGVELVGVLRKSSSNHTDTLGSSLRGERKIYL